MVKKTAFKKKLQQHTFEIKEVFKDPAIYFKKSSEKIIQILKETLKSQKNIKFRLILKIKLKKHDFDRDIDIEIIPYFDSKTKILYHQKDIEKEIKNAQNEIQYALDIFIQQGSGWVIDKLDELRLDTIAFKPLKGGCNSNKLPHIYRHKRSLISFNCKNDKCFYYCILAKLYPVSKNRYRVSNYNSFLSKLKTVGFKLPINIGQIPRFERLNNIRINIYKLHNNKPYPVHIGETKAKKSANILLHKNHYYLKFKVYFF